MVCNICGRENPEGARFCNWCGNRLQQEQVIAAEKIPEFKEGEIFADAYKIQRLVGKGSLATVYRAIDLASNRPVALKIINIKPEEDIYFNKYLNIVQSYAQLTHRNITITCNAGKWRGIYFVSTEFVEGKSIFKKVEEGGPLKSGEAVRIIEDVAKGLDFAHKRNLIHGGLTPANIFLTQDEVAKISDWGLNLCLAQTEAFRYKYPQEKLCYISPEQKANPQAADHRADIYSLGGVFYFLLTGENPGIIKESKLSDDLRGVILRCLEQKPENRFFSVAEFLQILLFQSIERKKIRVMPTVSPAEGIVCENCNYVNPLQARFCRECGAGLVQECPSCGAKDKPGIRFCTRCGIDIPKYKTVIGYLSKARSLEQECRYTEALEQLKTVLDLEPQRDDVRKEFERLRMKLDEVDYLRRKADALADMGNYDEAKSIYEKILIFSTGQPEIAKRYREVSRMAREGETVKLLLKAEECIKRKAYDEAIKICQGILIKDTSAQRAKELLKWARLESEGIGGIITGRLLHTITSHKGEVRCVALSPDARFLASAGEDNNIKIFDTYSWKEVKNIREHSGGVFSVSFSPDGHLLASAGYDKVIIIWDTAKWRRLKVLKGHAKPVNHVCFSHKGEFLASGSWDNTIKVWNTRTWKNICTLKGHTYYVYHVRFAPSDLCLASSSGDRTIKIWDFLNGKNLHTLYGHKGSVYSGAFSLDGKLFASASWDGIIKIWNTSSWKEELSFKGHTGLIFCLIFSPKGRIIASGSDDCRIKLRKALTGEELKTIEGHTRGIYSICFSPDGRLLFSGAKDSTIRIWEIFKT